MTTETIASADLEMDTLTLGDFIQKHVTLNPDPDIAVVYVQDDEGRTFEHVKLIAETLTDGSVVYNLVLS